MNPRGIFFFMLGIVLCAVSAPAGTFVVNEASLDVVDAAPGDGSCDTGARTPSGEAVCTLRAAVQEANALPGRDFIRLEAGRYRLRLIGRDEDGAARGDLDITDDVTIEGAGLDATFISWCGDNQTDCVAEEERDRIFQIRSNRPRILGFPLGTAPRPPQVEISELTVEDGIVPGFPAEAINQFPGLKVPGGGGILNYADLTLTRVRLRNNAHAFDEEVELPGGGGGICSDVEFENDPQPLLLLFEVIVVGNRAPVGGGVIASGDLLAIDSLIYDNTATGAQLGQFGLPDIPAAGGGLSTRGNALLVNSTVSRNQASAAAGIAVETGRLNVVNSTVSSNTAAAAGGGLLSFARFSSVFLRNTIVAGNSEPECVGAVNQAIVSLGNNLFESGGGCPATDEDWVTPDADQELGALADNGGGTLTHALRPGSLAIDRADQNTCVNIDFDDAFPPLTLLFDQRGGLRTLDGDADGSYLCDIGAYEAPPGQPAEATRVLPAAVDFPDNPALAYVFLGSPLRLGDRDPRSLIEPVFGPQRPDLWRLFRVDPASREDVEFVPGDSAFEFQPGRAFWMIARQGGELTFEGEPTDASGTAFPIPLPGGTSLIASPFNFPVDWSRCTVSRLPAGISPSLFRYDGPTGGFLLSDRLEPGIGYLATNMTASPLTLPISPLCALGDPASPVPFQLRGERPAMAASPSAAGGWRLRLSAHADGVGDVDNYLGADPAAADEKDLLDYPEPPVYGGLALYFRRADWGGEWTLYASDIRRASPRERWRRPIRGRKPIAVEESREWRFEVWSARPGSEIELSWELSGSAPRRLILVDLNAGRRIDLKAGVKYRFQPEGGGIRRFKVVTESNDPPE